MEVADWLFTGKIPELYDSLLVPLIFEPYARDLAFRVTETEPIDILETAPAPVLSPENSRHDFSRPPAMW